MRDVQEGVDREVRPIVLHERHDQARRIKALPLQHNQRNRNGSADDELQQQLLARGEAEITFLRDLRVVVRETDGGKGHRGEHHEPDEGVREIAPQQRGNEDGDADEHAAHGGRAALLLVALRTFFADVLADLKLAQAINDIWPDEQADEQRRQAREDAAKRDVAEDPEVPEVGKELLIEEPIEQRKPPRVRLNDRAAGRGPSLSYAWNLRKTGRMTGGEPSSAPARMCYSTVYSSSASSARSRRTPREPLSRTTSPLRRFCSSQTLASPGLSTNSCGDTPGARAFDDLRGEAADADDTVEASHLLARSTVQRSSFRAELEHLAGDDETARGGRLAKCFDHGLRAPRVGVVGVVDEPRAAEFEHATALLVGRISSTAASMQVSMSMSLSRPTLMAASAFSTLWRPMRWRCTLRRSCSTARTKRVPSRPPSRISSART